MSETKARRPRLEDGTRVFVTDGDNAGRVGVITSTVYTDELEAFKAKSGDQAVANFAQVDYYTIRTRDALGEYLEVKPDEISPTDGANFGRHTPPELVEEYAKEEQRSIDIQHRGLDPDDGAHPGSEFDLGNASAAAAVRKSDGLPPEEPEDTTADEGEEEGGDVRTVPELKDELLKRDLPVSGTRHELLARIHEDDLAKQGESGDSDGD